MFDLYFAPRTAERLQSGREAAVLARFLGYLQRRGHAGATVRQYVLAAEMFLHWLRRRQYSLAAIDEAVIRSFVCRRRSTQGAQHVAHAALRHLLLHLRREGRVTARTSNVRRVVGRVVGEFDVYLDRVCGLAIATRLYRRRYAREFLQFVFGAERIVWRRIGTEQVQDFLVQYGGDGRFAASQVAAVSLRSFLRWLQFKGLVNASLAASVPHFRQWRLASLPTILSEVQLGLFLATFDCLRPSGRRDYAMALCMVELGLRASEVADLRIDAINVERDTLRISSGKVRRDRLLPMPLRVRKAVTAYLRRDRPQTDSPFLFVRLRVPIGTAVTRELIRGVMRRAYAMVPGCEKWTGTHVLRHTAATRLQRAGADLKQVADILGHRSLDTTAIYTKVDLGRLAEVGLPWPGTEGELV